MQKEVAGSLLLLAEVAWTVHAADSRHGVVEVRPIPYPHYHGTRVANTLRCGEDHAGVAGREAEEEDEAAVGRNLLAYRLLGGFSYTVMDYLHGHTSTAVDVPPTSSLCGGVAMNWMA